MAEAGTAAGTPWRGHSPARWWWRRSLRARITVLATALFTAALALAGVVLLVSVNRSLLNTLDSSAERSGTEVAALVRSGGLPQQVLAGSGGVSLVQVVDGDNRVVAASPGADTAVSLLRADELTAVRGGAHLTVSGNRASLDEPLRVVGVRADLRSGRRTVLVATALGRVLDSSRLLQRGLLLGFPVIVAIMAALTWWLVGLTLRPVAALQRGAAELSAAGLARSRLPVPAAADEIRTLAITLNTMLDRLDAATTKQRRFVGDAAHELRSPIASLRVQLEVAKRLDESGAVSGLADDALIDVDRLSNLIDDLLTLARMDEDGPARSRQPVRLDELAASVVAGYGGARVPVTTGRCLPATVLGDRDGLTRVLVNLIDNAVRYARGSVTVSVTGPVDELGAVGRAGAVGRPGAARGPGEPAMACVSVADDGPGVPADKRERVFDRFYRLDDARSRSEGGTGLGLAIVREIVTAHGGTVRLRDNAPGLVAEVLLPENIRS